MPPALRDPLFTRTPEVLPTIQDHEEIQSSRTAWRVLLTACCGVFFSFASLVIYTFSVFLKPLSDGLGWTRTQISLAFTVTALTVAVCSPFIGRLLDRYPARHIVIPCTVIYGLAFASLALLTRNVVHLYATFLLLGIVGNGTAQLGYSRVVSAWFDRQRGRALAAVMAGSGVGSMVFPPLAQWLITHTGWRVAYAVLGGSVLAVAVPLAAVFLYEPAGSKPVSSSRGPEQESGPRLPSLVLSVPFLSIAGALLLFSFATNALTAHWSALLTDRGASAPVAGFVLAFAGCAALIGKLSTGYLLDRFRAGRTTSLLLLVAALGFCGILAGNAAWLAFASALCIGIGSGAESDAVPYLLTRYFGLARFSELYGYTWCVYAISGATGPAVMGVVFDRTGSYQTVLAVCLILVLGAAALFGSLPGYGSASTGSPSTGSPSRS